MIIFKGYTHIVLALALYLFIFPFNLIYVFLVAVGSLMPDIDHPHSLVGKYNLFAYFMKHRGFTHTLPALVLWFVIFTIEPILYLPFAFGYISHLLGDSCTRMGIMWLYPYKKKHYSIIGR